MKSGVDDWDTPESAGVVLRGLINPFFDNSTMPGSDSSFYEELRQEEGVCENCFKRTHLVVEDWYPETLGSERKKSLTDTQYHSVKQNTERVFPPSENVKEFSSGKRVCDDCGIVDHGAIIRPITKGRMIEIAQNICKWLDEEGEEYDKDVLFRCIRALKSNPDNQFRDDAILEVSLEQALAEGGTQNGQTSRQSKRVAG